MKRFLRYLLLSSCILVLAIWIFSIFYVFGITVNGNRLYAVMVDTGRIHFMWMPLPSGAKGVLHFTVGPVSHSLKSPIDALGLVAPQFFTVYSWAIMIPVWLLSVILIIPTVVLWHPLIKSKLRGSDRKGFEVEMKKNERQDAEVAKEEKGKE